MKIIKSLLLLFVLVCSMNYAHANTPEKHLTARLEIKSLIANSESFKNLNIETTVNVTFMVNSKNEIIILSTDTPSIDKSLKNVLNYTKLKSSDMHVNVTYTLPITLKK